MENYILLRDTEERINTLLDSRPLPKDITPIVNLIQTSNYYYIYIFLNGLIKKHISFKYVNNFLILNLSLVCTYNNKISEYKKTLYVKNLDIKNIQDTVNSDLLKYKIPIT